MDDELFKSAHEPAALWAKYLARRQKQNPLYLRRTLSYCPEATRIGAPPPTPAVASPRYVKLRLAADLAAYPARAVADAGAGRRPPRAARRYLGRFPLVSADFWTSDHLSERSRSVDAVSETRARGTLTLKRRAPPQATSGCA